MTIQIFLKIRGQRIQISMNNQWQNISFQKKSYLTPKMCLVLFPKENDPGHFLLKAADCDNEKMKY